jgi:hypothetical protein
LVLSYTLDHLKLLKALSLPFFLFLFFLFDNHLSENTFDGIFDRLFVGATTTDGTVGALVELSSCSSGNGLAVQTRLIIIHYT